MLVVMPPYVLDPQAMAARAMSVSFQVERAFTACFYGASSLPRIAVEASRGTRFKDHNQGHDRICTPDRVRQRVPSSIPLGFEAAYSIVDCYTQLMEP
jgi:hypothetical protein